MVDKKFQIPGDANGNLGKRVPSGKILVPGQIWPEGDGSRWILAGHAKLREPSLTMLNEFLALHESTGHDSILKFEHEWGVLAMTGGKGTSRPCAEAQPEGFDPHDAWRYFSRRATAVLRISDALKNGRLGDLADWGVIAAVQSSGEAPGRETLKAAIDRHKYGMGFASDIPRGTQKRAPVDQGRDIIAGEIEQWLSFWKTGRMRGLSDFTLQWSPDAQKWELQIDYHGYTFAAIALQLALYVADADSLYICSGCSRPYIRDRKRPKTGWANYCETCRAKGLALRHASDRKREKQAEVKRLAADGLPPAEIAARVNSDPETVQRWLRPAKKVEKGK